MRPWEKNIRQVVPYVPGEQPAGDKIVKLNTNENPYPPAPGVKKVLEEMEADRLRKYPDPTASILVKELASYYGLNEDQVFVGVGSDDVLAMSFLTFFNSDKPVLFPDVTYSFYKVWADLFKVPFETPVLKEDFTIDVKDYEKENGGVIFPNPNAPTGVYMPLDQVEEILKANQDVVVIVDEAYVDFAGIDSAIPADEVIWSMKRIGDVMSPTLKETAEGGLAATPTGRKLHDQVFGPGNVSGGCSGCSGCHS